MGSIKNGIESKGLVSVEKDGDLTVIASGSLDYGLNPDVNPLKDTCANCQAPQVDVLLWAGFKPPPGSAGAPQPRGTLRVDMIDRATNKEVWSGHGGAEARSAESGSVAAKKSARQSRSCCRSFRLKQSECRQAATGAKRGRSLSMEVQHEKQILRSPPPKLTLFGALVVGARSPE